jgi:hypothetical protein
VAVHPYAALDYARWTAWWKQGQKAREYPRFPNQWNTDATVVMSLKDGAPLPVNSGDSVLAGYQVAVGGRKHPAVAVSLASGSVQADVRCNDGRSYILTMPLPTNASTSIPEGDESFFPDSTNSQGAAVATGCDGVLQGAWFTALGISPGTGNPGGPAFTTSEAVNPLVTLFRISVDGSSRDSRALIVNFQP